MEDKAKRLRSPQFPFIPLEKAVDRARAFEGEYHHHPARATNAARLWGYAEKSSGGLQTIAALCAYGLMDEEGALENRKLKLSMLAMKILKDARPSNAAAALKAAALKPKVLAELWDEWKEHRPPDSECISTLHLDRQFSEDAAKRLLSIYDANISFAVLTSSDKMDSPNEVNGEAEAPTDEDKSVAPKSPLTETVQLMPNERVLYAHQNGPDQGFRLIVTGEVDQSLIDVLKAFVEFQEKVVGRPSAAAQKEERAA